MNNRSNMIKMGNHIADLRKKKGYTQKTLGDLLDVSDKTVCKWEKGIVAPDITILSSLANTLDVTVEEILSGEEVKTIDPIETIDIYSSMTKRKFLKIFFIFILIFFICTLFVFKIEEYYSWHLTPLYSEGEISSAGYILSNNKESKILINKIFFNENMPKDVRKIVISLKNKEEEIYNEIIEHEHNDLNEIMNNYALIFDYNKPLSNEKLELFIILYDSNNNLRSHTIIFK